LAVDVYDTSYAVASVASVNASDCVITLAHIDGAGVVYAIVINRERYGIIRIIKSATSVIPINAASVVEIGIIIRIMKGVFCVVIGTRDHVVTRAHIEGAAVNNAGVVNAGAYPRANASDFVIASKSISGTCIEYYLFCRIPGDNIIPVVKP
jgi:hypothetical protein